MSTVFKLYFCPEGGFYGLRSLASRKFLGISSWGNIGFFSSRLEFTERLALNRQSHLFTNGIMMMAANWGNGGWILKKKTGGVAARVSKGINCREDILLLRARRVLSMH